MFVSFDFQNLLPLDALTMRYVIITISCIIIIFKILPIHLPNLTLLILSQWEITLFIELILLSCINSVNPGRTIYPTWAPKRCLPPPPPQRWLLPQTPPPLRKIFITMKKISFFIYIFSLYSAHLAPLPTSWARQTPWNWRFPRTGAAALRKDKV